MTQRLSLRHRFYLILVAVFLINLVGGGVMIWFTYRMEGLLHTITEKNLAAFQTAEALENALINQKGFVSYYFLDNNPDWLKQLGQYRQIFLDTLARARRDADSPVQRAEIEKIGRAYDQYVAGKDQVIAYYRSGQKRLGLALHQKVRAHYSAILDLCENYKALHTKIILEARKAARQSARRLRISAVLAVVAGSLLIFGLAFFFVHSILKPVRGLIDKVGHGAIDSFSADEIETLAVGVDGLIEDSGETQLELAKSREQLLQAEKMAMVGKLAAGMAHSIRNPFTSVKMRLFSLGRTLSLSASQRDDFQVISEEIRHIDTVVQNFLEFSRPPKLVMQLVSPSAVIDQTLQLLSHRLKAYDVQIVRKAVRALPEVLADPEQLKEVLVNLIINACEAMGQGGTITIEETTAKTAAERLQAVCRISDSGPGMSEAVRAKAFQPFFTTKAEGTGLGLSIVERIISEHKGQIRVECPVNGGTTFIITLPVKETSV